VDEQSGLMRTDTLDNSELAELLAVAADSAKQPLQKALRRASRKALLWPEEASQLITEGRSLEELPGIGPSLNKIIRRWMDNPPDNIKPPEIRSGFLTWTQARKILAKDRSWSQQLKGDLQMHSLWSDGGDSIEDMAKAAASRGYEYIAITDHAKGLKIAGGIDENELAAQADEIAKVNQAMSSTSQSLRVLHSIELNLNTSGEGDMDGGSLSKLDLVLGCFHSALRKKEDQTERYLAALRNSDIQILGHPRGRIYNFRLGLTCEWRQVFDLAAELGKAVEIDCYPDRQDLSGDLVKLAAKAGCRISLGTDSHGESQLRFIEFGLGSALAAGIKPDRILNFMTAEELKYWAAGVRERDRSKSAA
jgi:histidinol phosphatase-like PHP family hydrolase